MKRSSIVLINFFIFSIFATALGISQEITGFDIMKRVDERPVPADATMQTIMKLIDKRGKERVRTIKTYRFGDNKQIMWFLEPADVKGSSFLKHEYDDRDDDMWLYLPAFGKERRIASHQVKGSFMGSDFTYEDMGDRDLKDYTYKVLKEESLDDKACWVIESIPNDGVVTDYSKIVSWVRKDADTPAKEEFYDKRGNLKKVKNVEVINIEEFWLLSTLVMENLKSEHKTEIYMNDIEINTGLKESLFETRSMKRIH
ncbi:outer membrane lipoprotein-sorting protein [candidate division KSB1 bacterium]